MKSLKQLVASWASDSIITNAAGSAAPPSGGPYGQLDLLDAMPVKARVDRYGALLSNDFLACETTKARAIRSLPASILRRADNGRIPAEDHPISALLHRPNALMSWGDLIEWAVIRRDVFGTAYVRVVRHPTRGTPLELRPVLAAVNISFDVATGIATYEAGRDYYNDPWIGREDDVVVIKTDVSEDGGKTGRSLVELAAEDIGLSVDLVRFYRTVVENGNHFQGWLETDKALDPNDIKAVRESLNATSGPDDAGGIRLFDRGLKYREVQMQLADMDIVAQERFVLEKVCRACHVDMHHVFADGKAAATTSSGADIDFVKNTVLPEVTAIEEAFQPVLDRARSLGGTDSGYRLKLNVNGLLRGDFKARMEGYRIGVYSGIFTRAYCATQEDIPWLPGQDGLLQPTAYYVLDEDGTPTIPDVATLGTMGQSDGISGIDEKAIEDNPRNLLMPVIRDASERIAKRARSDGDCPKTRAFADQVMHPISVTALLAQVELDDQKLIDEAIAKGLGA